MIRIDYDLLKIMQCIYPQSNEGAQERSFILNKMAQIISLAFVVDYPSRWPSFFDDMLQTLNRGHQAVGMYLRVLLAIDQEVVDREVIHTAEVRGGTYSGIDGCDLAVAFSSSVDPIRLSGDMRMIQQRSFFQSFHELFWHGHVHSLILSIKQVALWVASISNGGFFLTCEDFGRMFDHSFPACVFKFFLMEISLCTLIPLFMPGSVHSGSVS